MTTQFPDISEWTPVSLRGAPMALARATISNVKDTHWDSNVADALMNNIPLWAYCFLNSGKLGVSPEAQAEFAFSVVGSRPTMLDHEPNRGQCATFDESLRWIDRFRALGGICHLDYLPKWAWGNPAGVNGLGKPDLQPLADRDMLLVASNYTTYSDTGAGWNSYYTGCPVPVVQWQFTSTFVFNGVQVDWNAFKGTVEEYSQTIQGGDMSTESVAGNTERLAGNGDTWGRALVTGEDPAKFLAGVGQGTPATTPNVMHEKLGSLSSRIDQILAAVTSPIPVTLADTQLQQIINAVVSAHPALGDADKPAIEAALREVLHSA